MDLDGDCKFSLTDGRLSIVVPGSGRPHDLSAELDSTNAPCVLRPLTGAFVLTVKVDGGFAPGEVSTQPGRTPYNGAGLLLISDTRNYVRLEYAALHDGDAPVAYTNFEIRVDGQVLRFGRTGDRPLKLGQSAWLRLARSGPSIRGWVSDDGTTWDELPAKEVPPEWCNEMKVGVAAISTATAPFKPSFSELKLEVPADSKDGKQE
jgi:regulation of enolase protein 1 (concanavalin A-like superfamily)